VASQRAKHSALLPLRHRRRAATDQPRDLCLHIIGLDVDMEPWRVVDRLYGGDDARDRVGQLDELRFRRVGSGAW
jgi:hypothetical protein